MGQCFIQMPECVPVSRVGLREAVGRALCNKGMAAPVLGSAMIGISVEPGARVKGMNL